MTNKILLLVVVCFIALGTTNAYAEGQEKLYTTGDELSQALIAETADGGKLTAREQTNLLRNSSQTAQKELADEAIQETGVVLEEQNISLSDESHVEKSFELDCGVTCTVNLTDEEDISLMAKFLGGLLVEEASANTTPEVLWKDYGDRKFTAWVDIAFFGGITMKEVICYSISDSGLKVTSHEALNNPPWGFYRIHKKSSICEDQNAMTKGDDIHVAGKFWIYKDVEGIWLPYKIKLVRAKVKLVALDTKRHCAQLYQTCEYENL